MAVLESSIGVHVHSGLWHQRFRHMHADMLSQTWNDFWKDDIRSVAYLQTIQYTCQETSAATQ
jgi:hypothetical protein